MYRKSFVYLCRRTFCPMYTIFNTIHAIADVSNIYKLQDIWRLFTRVRTHSDRQTESINTFQLCWKMFKTISDREEKEKNRKSLKN